jgi:hypothetical protein
MRLRCRASGVGDFTLDEAVGGARRCDVVELEPGPGGFDQMREIGHRHDGEHSGPLRSRAANTGHAVIDRLPCSRVLFSFGARSARGRGSQ